MEERLVFRSRRHTKPAGCEPETQDPERTRSGWDAVSKFRAGRPGPGAPAEAKWASRRDTEGAGSVFISSVCF